MGLIDFYKRVAESLGIHVSKDDYLEVDMGGKYTPLTMNGKPMVLPTPEQIDTSIEIDDSGTPSVTKILYNPLNEDVIKGDSSSLKKTKDIVERMLGHSFAAVGDLLLKLSAEPKLQKKTDMELNKFLVTLSSATTGKTKAMVDDKSITLWSKIYQKSLEIDPSKGFTRVYLKKLGKLDGVKYNRLAVLGLPIYEDLLGADRDTPIFGITLRTKDIGVYKLLHEYVYGGLLDNNNTVQIGSNDPEAPGFISLFKLYIKVANRMNKILKSLKFIDQEYAKKAMLNIGLTLKELENIHVYKPELLTIPSEIEMNRKTTQPKTQIISGINPIQPNTVTQTVTPQMVNQQPQQQQVVQQPKDETPTSSVIHKVLYGQGGQPQQMVQNPMLQPQQPMVMQQPTQQPMVIQQPMVMQNNVNPNSLAGMQQSMNIQQPMYQQPYQQTQQPYQGYQQQVRPIGI